MWLFSLSILSLLITSLGYPDTEYNLQWGLCTTRYQGCGRFPYRGQDILVFYYTVLSIPFDKSSNTRVAINIWSSQPLIQYITRNECNDYPFYINNHYFPYWPGISIPIISCRCSLQGLDWRMAEFPTNIHLTTKENNLFPPAFFTHLVLPTKI